MLFFCLKIVLGGIDLEG